MLMNQPTNTRHDQIPNADLIMGMTFKLMLIKTTNMGKIHWKKRCLPALQDIATANWAPGRRYTPECLGLDIQEYAAN